MDKFFKSPIFRDPYITISSALSILMMAVAWSISIFSLSGLSHLLIIHFTASGIDFLGTSRDVFGVLFSGLAIFSMNSFLIFFIYSRFKPLAHFFSFFNLFFTLLILIFVGVIISIN